MTGTQPDMNRHRGMEVARVLTAGALGVGLLLAGFAAKPAKAAGKASVHSHASKKSAQAGATAPPQKTAVGLGIFCEGGDNLPVTNNFSTWLGKPVRYRVSFADYQTWKGISGVFYMPQLITWLGQNPKNYEVLSVGLTPVSDPSDFAAVANGSRDEDFKALAKLLVANHIADRCIIRLAWEMNGNWMAWSVKGNTTGFVAAFRRAIQDMREVYPGFKVCWNLNLGMGAEKYDWHAIYPGDDVVDYIGIDAYDFWNPKGWDSLLNANPGLRSVRAFAKAHGKPEAYPEWGMETESAHGHGDDAAYITNMYNWFHSGNVAFQAYWNNTCCSTLRLFPLNPTTPASAATYLQLFGATGQRPPGAIFATAGNKQVSLVWTADPSAKSYRIYRGTQKNAESLIAMASGITTTSYINTGITNGKTYYYKVKSISNSGTSGYSDEASAMPGVPPLASGIYTLSPANAPSTRLTVTGSSSDNGANVDVETSTGATNQRWTLSYLGANAYTLAPAYAVAEVLDCNGQYTTSGTNVQIWENASQLNQHWSLASTSNGFTLTPRHATGLRLNTTGKNSGSNVDIEKKTGGAEQIWKLVRVNR